MSKEKKAGKVPAPVVNTGESLQIRYRGILTFRGLRLIALIFMTLSQTGALITPAAMICSIFNIPFLFEGETILQFFSVTSSLGQASFAMLMVSSIGLVLNRQVSFKKMLIEYFVLALITYLATVFIIAGMIHSAVYNMPMMVPVLETLFDGVSLMDVVKGLLRMTAKLIVPGDGTVQFNAVNEIVAAFGARISLPDMDQLIAMLPTGRIPKDLVRSIISQLATHDVAPVMDKLVDKVVELYSALPADIIQKISDIVLPRLETAVGSMMNINVFWNLFLYTLFYYFIAYEPKNTRPSKKMLFRCCAVLPGFWLVLSFFVSTELRMSATIKIPIWFIALLSNVRPATLVLFFMMVVYVKYFELEYTYQEGKHRLSLDEYFQSKVASLQFSIGVSAGVILICIADYLLGMIPRLVTWGFGKSTMMWLCIPAVMLYSFNKMPKHKALNCVIPLYYLVHFFTIIVGATAVAYYLVMVISGKMTPEALLGP